MADAKSSDPANPPPKKEFGTCTKGVILTGGYSDNYCKRPLYSMHLFAFIFTVL